MLRIFIGYDHRQPVSYTALCQSIIDNSSEPVAITPLVYRQLKPGFDDFWMDENKNFRQFIEAKDRRGLTPFTWSRFLVPHLCNYEGWALFLDIDMLVLDDIVELFKLKNDKYAVMVSKNDHRFEWASAMLFNCAKCKILTPEYVKTAQGLHTINWVNPEEIGDFPREWNHLVGYDPERKDAKLVHYTQGVPAHAEIGECEYANEWRASIQKACTTASWFELMGTSVHATDFDGKRVSKLLAKKLSEFKQEISQKPQLDQRA